MQEAYHATVPVAKQRQGAATKNFHSSRGSCPPRTKWDLVSRGSPFTLLQNVGRKAVCAL